MMMIRPVHQARAYSEPPTANPMMWIAMITV
jgi:hypothetical protein